MKADPTYSSLNISDSVAVVVIYNSGYSAVVHKLSRRRIQLLRQQWLQRLHLCVQRPGLIRKQAAAAVLLAKATRAGGSIGLRADLGRISACNTLARRIERECRGSDSAFRARKSRRRPASGVWPVPAFGRMLSNSARACASSVRGFEASRQGAAHGATGCSR